MKKQDYIEWIERYSQGELNKSELKQFKSELSSNKELKEVYNLYNLSLDAIETDIEKDLRNDLQTWEKESTTQISTSAKIVPFRRKMMTWAAAASFLLLAGFFGMNYFGNPSGPTASFDTHFDNYYSPATISTIRDSSSPDIVWEAIYDKLEAGNHSEAIEALNEIGSVHERYAEAQYLKGQSHVSLENWEAALSSFKNAKNAGESRFKEKSEWNYVLCLMKQEEISTEFMPLLNKIANQNHGYDMQAKELLNTIESE